MIFWICYILVVAIALGFPVAAALHVRWLLKRQLVALPNKYTLLQIIPAAGPGTPPADLRVYSVQHDWTTRANWETFYP